MKFFILQFTIIATPVIVSPCLSLCETRHAACFDTLRSLSVSLFISLQPGRAYPSLLCEVTHSRRMNERTSERRNERAANTCREHFIRDASYAGPLSGRKGFPGRTSPRCLRKVLLRASVSMRDTGSTRRDVHRACESGRASSPSNVRITYRSPRYPVIRRP